VINWFTIAVTNGSLNNPQFQAETREIHGSRGRDEYVQNKGVERWRERERERVGAQRQ
jgi:hypothetical protein